MHTASPAAFPSVLISAGGTGGHIFPGIALGQALARIAPEIPVHYVCGSRPLELKLYATEGFQPHVLPSTAVTGGLVRKISAIAKLGLNTGKAVLLLRRLKVGVVVGFGGYSTGPIMAAAFLTRRRTVLHEANAVPGKANRLMAPWAHLVTGHFSTSVDGLRATHKKIVGMPLRKRQQPPSQTEACEILELDPARRTLLITGGSQGARNLNLRALEAIRLLDVLPNRDFQILWATGHNHHAEITAQLEAEPTQFLQIHAVPFVERMDCAMAVAEAAIARAGASTVAELIAAGVYPCLIPFPFAVHNHQVRNAQVVQDQQAGWMMEEKDLNVQTMTDILRRLMEKVRTLTPGTRKAPPVELDSTEAADRLARLVLEQLGWKPRPHS
jgi:UDP-N-acetylglucosamine--N-acetylmuramyl-(pentapeptide) pyrophosphoryl-undecaprenol N-acetylglucosamine transferase